MAFEMKSLKSACLTTSLHIISVESSFIRALPGFELVGLASTTIKESLTRVRSALCTIADFSLPSMKIVINLSPSDVKKDGSHFDLPIALLITLQKSDFDSDFYAFGELGLDGSLKSSAELFCILLFLSTKVKNAKVILPADIANKASMIPNLEVYAAKNLAHAKDILSDPQIRDSAKISATHPLFSNALDINGRSFVPNLNYALDFSDIKGQERAKRACLIAAAGMHNILFEGSPGCGKSMCAKRLTYILPPQSLDEILLATAYQSLNATIADFSALRAFRSPHHTSTRSAIFGGGTGTAKIGEVALANGGVLFFDELPHFGKNILESLREPLEDNEINISRVNSKTNYKTKFLFAAAMNPCPCGNRFSPHLPCVCSDTQVARYQGSISAALLDRIDLYVAMAEVSSEDRASVSSHQMATEVLKAFKAQLARGQNELNGKLNDADIRKFCVPDSEAQSLLDRAITTQHLSQRGVNKALKVARTIADLANSVAICKPHILEALSFRVKYD